MAFGGNSQNFDQNDMNGRGFRSSSGLLKPIKVRREMNDEKSGKQQEDEPLSPMARMFHEPESNVYIVVIVGFKNPIDPDGFKANFVATLLKHPRFSSVQVADEKNGGKLKWIQTEVNIDNHVVVCNLSLVDDENIMRSSRPEADKFVEDYVANISKTEMSMSIPMWDCHILNLKTSDAESTLVIRVHHSLGDGTSLMSLLLSCSRKVSDPDALPTLSAMKKINITTRSARGLCLWSAFLRFWSLLLLLWNTLVDLVICVATTYFLKDTHTPLKPPSASTSILAVTPRRIVRRTFSFSDVKLVKNATNTTVNDVMLAIAQAGLSRYLNREYGKIKSSDGKASESENNLPKNIRLRATLFFNLRSSLGIYAISEMVKKNSEAEWGNKIGYVLFPFRIALKDDKPLDYIRDVKAKMTRKKATLEPNFRLFMAKVFVRFYSTKLASFPATTLWFSNVAGPQDEVSIFGNQVAFIAPSLYGQPVPLTIHVVSYASKISMVLSVDENIVADPHQLCDDFEESLKLIKKSIIAEGFMNN